MYKRCLCIALHYWLRGDPTGFVDVIGDVGDDWVGMWFLSFESHWEWVEKQ